jgi:hypothetical protein
MNAPLFERHFHFQVFCESESINSCELSGKERSQNLAYPNVSIPPPEIWKYGKPEFTALISNPSVFIRCQSRYTERECSMAQIDDKTGARNWCAS